jgi:hypothetical protein
MVAFGPLGGLKTFISGAAHFCSQPRQSWAKTGTSLSPVPVARLIKGWDAGKKK